MAQSRDAGPAAVEIPVFVRSGAILPFLFGDDVDTLCDPNYVNNPGVKTWDGGLEFHVYPAGTSRLRSFDGAVTCAWPALGRRSLARLAEPARDPAADLRPRPTAVRRDGATFPEGFRSRTVREQQRRGLAVRCRVRLRPREFPAPGRHHPDHPRMKES